MIPSYIINRIAIYTDKTLSKITGSRVEFTDESWCDINTKETYNKGGGYLSFGIASDIDAEFTANTTDLSETAYQASKVEIKEIRANLIIRSSPDINIHVKVSEELFSSAKIKTWVENETLHITGRVSERRVIRADDDHHLLPRKDEIIIIEVPNGIDLTIEKIYGYTRINNIECVLRIIAVKFATNIEYVRNSYIESRSSSVNIVRATGAITLHQEGSGCIRVQDAELEQIDIKNIGSGFVEIGGVSQYAKIKAIGSGRVIIERVTHEPIAELIGSGFVRINNWNKDKPK